MTHLSEFLLARIAEDEERAQSVREVGIQRGNTTAEAADELELIWDDWGYVLAPPARVLAECEARRRIVELHREFLVERLDDEFPGDSCDALCEVDNDDFPCATLRLLALPYASHPDYDEAWRP